MQADFVVLNTPLFDLRPATSQRVCLPFQSCCIGRAGPAGFHLSTCSLFRDLPVMQMTAGEAAQSPKAE